jgi:putative Mg2+ transporter-C (MgtC) family protein
VAAVIDLATFHLAMFTRIALATALGAFVGFERERVGKPAGVRTHGMVALGSALFTVVSIYGFEGKSDPARIAAQIVTGIGFLGAGTILHLRGSVHGLTTAATLWVTAAIGVAVGAGMTLMSIETAALAWILLRFGPRLEPPKGEAGDDPVW